MNILEFTPFYIYILNIEFVVMLQIQFVVMLQIQRANHKILTEINYNKDKLRQKQIHVLFQTYLCYKNI